MTRKEIKTEDLMSLEVGTIIKYSVWDNDDSTIWKFIAIRIKDGFIYLGGGIDFGSAIGNKMSFEKVLSDINSVDFPRIEVMNLILSNVVKESGG